jgi:hypothetical protein
MMGFERSDDYQPLLWIRGRPVHATVLLVTLHCVALIVFCVFRATRHPIDGLLAFSTDAAWHHGAFWQFFTYGFCHSPGLSFLLDMFFLYMWGLCHDLSQCAVFLRLAGQMDRFRPPGHFDLELSGAQ